MKFMLAVVIQILLGLFLMCGLIQAVSGNFWLLTAAVSVYLVLLVRTGCVSH